MRHKEAWRDLRAVVAEADFTLTEAVFSTALDLFRSFATAGEDTPAAFTREYTPGAQEFLLVVDARGEPVPLAPLVFDTHAAVLAQHPALAEWFRPEWLPEGQRTLPQEQHTLREEGRSLPEGQRMLLEGQRSLPEGQRVLLAARWLCHLAGLRHSTVEMFIDPPRWVGYTLVQVRSMSKFEAPGAFDIPCAGHMSGTEDAETALRKELREELNLTFDNLDDIRLLGQYNSYSDDPQRGTLNNERRILYRASLRPESVRQVNFADGEVAGLAVFNVQELRSLVERYPERIASGLSGAMDYL